MKLSVVILNYNVRYFLELCLKSVQAAITTVEAEIIVVDNHSSDDSCTMVKQLFPEVILIENKENIGFSKGNNIGVSKAKGDYICILNPDTVVAEDTFLKLLDFAGNTPKMGIVGCKLIDGHGNYLPESKRNIPTPLVAIKKILGYSKPYYANHLAKDEVGKVSVLVGAFMFLKRSVYNEVHGFDEDYFMYGEDVDLSYTILKKGFDNFYLGTSSVIHFKGESTLKNKDYAKRFYDAMQIFYSKHFKSHLLFDVLVWFGIKLASFFKTETHIMSSKAKEYIVVSDKKYKGLASVLDKPVVYSNQFKTNKNNIEVIFDANVLSYKSIIEEIDASPKNSSLTFKILPKASNFIIGSNSSKSRGEIITFH